MIIVTRPSPYGEELVQWCQQANLTAKHMPFFSITKGHDVDRLQQQLNQLTQGDIVIVVSPQVVFMLQQHNIELQFPNFLHYFAVGRQTAELFQTLSKQRVNYPIHSENSEGLIHYFQSIQLPVKHHQVLILSGDISRTIIQDELKNQGAQVKNIYCYQRNAIVYPTTMLANHQNDDFVITSIEHLLQLERYCNNQHKQNAHLIVSSETILNEAQKRDWQHIYLATSANNKNLFKTIVSLCHNATIT